MYQLQTKYQHEIFYESHLMAKKICMWFAEHTADADDTSGLETVVTNGGMAAALVELFTRKQVCQFNLRYKYLHDAVSTS
jgi:hypothetical protein